MKSYLDQKRKEWNNPINQIRKKANDKFKKKLTYDQENLLLEKDR